MSVRVTDEVPDALEAKRICLGECPRHEDMRILQRQRHGVLVGEVHVSLIEDHDPFLRAAQRVQLPPWGSRDRSGRSGVVTNVRAARKSHRRLLLNSATVGRPKSASSDTALACRAVDFRQHRVE